MFQQFLMSVALVGSVFGLTMVDAFQKEKEVHLAPTERTSEVDGQEMAERIEAVAVDVLEAVMANGEPAEQPDVEYDRQLSLEIQDRLLTTLSPPQKKDQDSGPFIDAWSAILVDANTNAVLWQKNPDTILPIASITKLMTAVTWLDHQPPAGFDHVHTFAPEQDTIGGKELNLGHGEQLNAFNLFRSSIVGSDNDTALGLVATTEVGEGQFVEWMNEKASALEMHNTQFDDATGLSANNRSTVRDLAKLANAAFGREAIRVPAGMTEHRQETVDGRFTRVATTNQLLYDNDVEIIAGKTGYITAAGYCLVVLARVPESDREVIAVVLGTDSNQARFDETKKLLQWGFDHYQW